MLTHILDQPHMQLGDGPIGLVLAPTRELATQICHETKRFAQCYNIRVCAVYGGAGKWEMSKALKEAPEIVVATPGRLIEMIRNKATNLTRCTFVVLDEADRMFEMGFEYQMRSIVQHVRPDRQVLLFSATMKKKIESFAREMLHDEVRVSIGRIGQASPDIQQSVQVLASDELKWQWLASEIDEFAAEGKVLVFVLTKGTAEWLSQQLQSFFRARQLDIGVETLHGDKDQQSRQQAMRSFSRSSSPCCSILVATDLASRGLDVKNIRTVVNYEVPKNIETYVHRIGRTGRMGIDGVTPGTLRLCAFSLLQFNLTMCCAYRNRFHPAHCKGLLVRCGFGAESSTFFAASQ
jgi:ATP-dependent RNA helicase DDX42